MRPTGNDAGFILAARARLSRFGGLHRLNSPRRAGFMGAFGGRPICFAIATTIIGATRLPAVSAGACCAPFKGPVCAPESATYCHCWPSRASSWLGRASPNPNRATSSGPRGVIVCIASASQPLIIAKSLPNRAGILASVVGGNFQKFNASRGRPTTIQLQFRLALIWRRQSAQAEKVRERFSPRI